MEDSEIAYKKALTEVYVIINNLTEDLYTKIPISFKKKIKDNMDISYKTSIEELENKGKMQETIDIMALVYRDFLCDKETKFRLKNDDEKEINDSFNIAFQKKDELQKADAPEQVMNLVVVREKWYQKILKKFMNYFQK